MFCAWCGKPARWRCHACGRFGPTAWLAFAGALTWGTVVVGSVLYLWKLLPTVAAIMAGLDHELEAVTRWHVFASNVSFGYGLALVVPAVFLWWLRRRGASVIRALGAFAVLGTLALAFTLAAVDGALFSLVVYLPSVLRLQVSVNEYATIDDLRHVAKAGSPITCQQVPSDFLVTKNGYKRGCTPGSYWATPEVVWRTGVRGLAADATGRICFTSDGTVPNMSSTCKEIQ